MATTIGIKLYYKEATADSVPTTITAEEAAKITTPLLGVQNIPELQTAPSSIDVTSLEDTEEQADPGLISGSALGITMNYKMGVYSSGTEDKSNFEQCLALSNDYIHEWKIVLPNGRWFAFYGKARTTTGGMSVATALQFTLTLFKRSKVSTGYTAVSAQNLNTFAASGIVKAPAVNTPEEEQDLT